MSKAFTRDDGENSDDDLDIESENPIPQGSKNYITPQGAEKLRKELHELLYTQRPETTKVVQWAASLGDRSENADYQYNKKKLREIDRRIRFLTKRLEAAEIVDPSQMNTDKVHFGATVTIRYEDGTLKKYSIVGVDEIDIKAGRISWISPLGSSLLKTKKGDFFIFRSPKGEEDLEIVDVVYETLP